MISQTRKGTDLRNSHGSQRRDAIDDIVLETIVALRMVKISMRARRLRNLVSSMLDACHHFQDIHNLPLNSPPTTSAGVVVHHHNVP